MFRRSAPIGGDGRNIYASVISGKSLIATLARQNKLLLVLPSIRQHKPLFKRFICPTVKLFTKIPTRCTEFSPHKWGQNRGVGFLANNDFIKK
jgi:hypothetical protein